MFVKLVVLACSLGFLKAAHVQKVAARVLIGKTRSGDGNGVKLDIKTRDDLVQMELQPADSVWLKGASIIKTGKDSLGRTTVEHVEVSKLKGKVYHNLERGATLLLDGNGVQGVIDQSKSISFDGQEHYVYTNFGGDEDFQDFVFPDDEVNATQPNATPFQREAMTMQEEDILKVQLRLDPEGGHTVETVFVVDYALAQEFNFAVNEIYNYVSVIVNGVNVRYFSIPRDDKIKIKVIAVYIIADQNFQPDIIETNKFSNDKYNGNGILTSFRTFVKDPNVPDFPATFDFAYLLLNKDIERETDGVQSQGLRGLAYVGTICDGGNNPDASTSYSVGISEDKGDYSGVHTTAHELAHSLGSRHDGSGNSLNCDWNEGYIMSYLNKGSNKLFFSPCSISSIYDTISKVSCLSIVDHQVNPSCLGIISKLPGDVTTGDEYCQKVWNDPSATVLYNYREVDVCTQIHCSTPQTGVIRWSSNPAPTNLYCVHGKVIGRCKGGVCDANA